MSVVQGGDETHYIDDEMTRAITKERTGIDTPEIRSQWSGQRLLTINSSSCELTKLRVEKSSLNQQGELRDVRLLAHGVAGQGETLSHHNLTRYKAALGIKVVSGSGIKAPDESVKVVCFRVKAGVLGLSSEFLLALLESETDRVLFSKMGKRNDQGWYAI